LLGWLVVLRVVLLLRILGSMLLYRMLLGVFGRVVLCWFWRWILGWIFVHCFMGRVLGWFMYWFRRWVLLLLLVLGWVFIIALLVMWFVLWLVLLLRWLIATFLLVPPFLWVDDFLYRYDIELMVERTGE
jgi:hypothetical protein